MRATWLRAVLTDAGLTVRVYPGWETRGASTLDPRGIMWHHTVTQPPMSAEDALLAVKGNATTPPPLANYSTNRDGSISLIAAGVANHGGAGSWKGIAGNRFFLGDEMKNLALPKTNPEPWPDVQLDAARRAAAAILIHIGRDVSWLCGHKEYAPTRKSDPHSLSMDNERRLVGALIANTAQEDDMWQYLNISEALVRHAWTEGWLQPGTPATLDYFLTNLAKLQEATAPAGFEEDWLNFRRAVTNGIALGKATAAGVPDLSGYAKVGHGHEAHTTIT